MENKRNLLYFQATTMKDLYSELDKWQVKNQKRLLSINIQNESDKFSCIALTNPTEVCVVNLHGDPADVVDGRLAVTSD